MNEDALSGKALGAVAGDSIAVVEVTMLTGVELNVAAIVRTGGKATNRTDLFDGSEVPFVNAKGFVGCGELNAVSDGELSFDLPIDADAC